MITTPVQTSSFAPSAPVLPQRPVRGTRQDPWNPIGTTGGDGNKDEAGGWGRIRRQRFGGPGGGDGLGGSPHGGGSDARFPQNVHPKPDGGNFRMKLGPPKMFGGHGAPFTTLWLTAVYRWAWVTGIPQDYLYDAIATRMKGGAATWINSQL